jgi:anti-sigma B factor antagonist
VAVSLLEPETRSRRRVIEDNFLTICIDGEASSCLVQLFGELDVASVSCFEAELRRIEAETYEAIVIDLSGLDFMDSSGIQILVEAVARSRANGDRMRVLRGTHQVDQVLRLTGLDAELPYLD